MAEVDRRNPVPNLPWFPRERDPMELGTVGRLALGSRWGRLLLL